MAAHRGVIPERKEMAKLAGLSGTVLTALAAWLELSPPRGSPPSIASRRRRRRSPNDGELSGAGGRGSAARHAGGVRLARNPDEVRTYVGHSTFLIEAQLVRIATDYNDYVRPRSCPTSSP